MGKGRVGYDSRRYGYLVGAPLNAQEILRRPPLLRGCQHLRRQRQVPVDPHDLP